MKKYEIKFDERNKRMLEMLSPKKKEKILVIGTGAYPKIEKFLIENYSCENIVSGDIDRKNIEKGSKIFPKISFVYLDAQKRFNFKEEEFDIVILTEVLEHLKNENLALSEIRRVLKKNGRLLLSVPRRRWFNVFSPITHIQPIREYNQKSLSNVLKRNKFEIKKMIVGGDIYDLLNLWVHLIFKYCFKQLKINPFFETRIERTWKKGYSGKGTDLVVIAIKK